MNSEDKIFILYIGENISRIESDQKHFCILEIPVSPKYNRSTKAIEYNNFFRIEFYLHIVKSMHISFELKELKYEKNVLRRLSALTFARLDERLDEKTIVYLSKYSKIKGHSFVFTEIDIKFIINLLKNEHVNRKQIIDLFYFLKT